jgi:hypothetical protein
VQEVRWDKGGSQLADNCAYFCEKGQDFLYIRASYKELKG